jgi:hypothetical protein
MKQLNEIKRLQQLAGINEIKINNPNKPLKLTWLKNDEELDNYYEKGLEDENDIIDGIEVRGIIGYFEDEEGDEDSETIGYISSITDINKISDNKLWKFFYKEIGAE